MCEERFDGVTQLDEGSALDAAVTNVSKEIIDDYPASDPRWAEAIPAGKYLCELVIITDPLSHFCMTNKIYYHF